MIDEDFATIGKENIKRLKRRRTMKGAELINGHNVWPVKMSLSVFSGGFPMLIGTYPKNNGTGTF